MIDAKVSLNAYLDAFGAVDEAKRDDAPRRACHRRSALTSTARRQGLLVAVRRCARLCRDVHPGRAFPDRRARAGRRPVGLCVRQEGAAGDADQPDRHRPHRRGASGGRRSWPRKRGRSASLARSCTSGLPRPPTICARSAAASRQPSTITTASSPALRAGRWSPARKFRELNIEPRTAPRSIDPRRRSRLCRATPTDEASACNDDGARHRSRLSSA